MIIRAGTITLCCAVVSLLLGSCEETPAPSSPLPRSQSLPLTPFRLGFQETHEGTWEEETAGLAGFLEKALAQKLQNEGYDGVTLTRLTSHEECLQALKVGKFEVVHCSPLVYVEARDNYQAAYIPILRSAHPADERLPGSVFEKVVIAVRVADNINRLEELKGSPFGFVSDHSYYGYYYPQVVLRDAGFAPEDVRPVFCGSSREVVKYLLTSLVDGGVCREDDLKQITTSRWSLQNSLKVIHRLPYVPTNPILIRSDLHGKVLDYRFRREIRYFASSRGAVLQYEPIEDEKEYLAPLRDNLEKIRPWLSEVRVRNETPY